MPFVNIAAFLAMPLCLFAGLAAGWILARRWRRDLDRQEEASSQEILDEMKAAFVPRRTVEIRTQTEYLPFLFERILENIDSGFGAKQSNMLLERIQIHKPRDIRNAVFPVESGGVASDLDFQWQRDCHDRIQLFITAVPKIARAVKLHSRTIPRAALGR